MGKIYFRTRAYNAEKTVARCVESVLNQTKYGENIEYWLLENGSTDRTREIIEEYARNDPRIRLFYNEKNNISNSQSSVFLKLPQMLKEDDFLCYIDSDDEYKLDFLEKMIPFMLENDLDIAMGGNDFIDSGSGQLIGQRVLPQTLILDTANKFAQYFSVYHQFARTVWGKIYTGKIANKVVLWNDRPEEFWKNLRNGSDTYMVFSMLRHSNRVGIFPESFYKYYISSKSGSRVWLSGRFNSNMILNEDAEDYLERFGPISEQNREFLNRVFANAVSDSLKVLCEAQGMTAEDKLRELRKAVDYRVTSDMMAWDNPDVARCRKNIFNAALRFGRELKQENKDLRAALMLICPNCTPFIAADEIELYARENGLQNALLNDNMTELVDQLLHLISKGAYTKQFDLFKIVERLSADRGAVLEITDNDFVKKHGEIYLLLWQKKYIQALDNMTERLLNKRSLGETFLQVYLTLAALLESVDEFVLGKVKLAAFYCDQNKKEECRAVLDDLAEMGVEDNDEITEIKAKLNSR